MFAPFGLLSVDSSIQFSRNFVSNSIFSGKIRFDPHKYTFRLPFTANQGKKLMGLERRAERRSVFTFPSVAHTRRGDDDDTLFLLSVYRNQ